MGVTLITSPLALALITLPVATSIPSSLSAPPSLATITIAGYVFVVDPSNVILDGTTVQPASAGISIDGQVVSVDAADDLFVDGTKVLAHPTSSNLTRTTAIKNTASLSSSNTTISRSASGSSVTVDASAQPNTITTGPTLAIPTMSLLPTGSVASSQAMLLVGAIFGITEEAKTLSAIIKDDGPKESFIKKFKETDDDILSFLEDMDPPDPPPSYDDACLDGASILNILKDLGCLKGGFDEVISDLEDEAPDVDKIQIKIDNIGKLAKNLEKEEDDDDDDETSTSETNAQASKSQDSAMEGSSTSMSSTTPRMTSAASSRILSSASTATASMQPLVVDRYPLADPDTSNYSTPDISDQALMAFLGDVLSSEVGVGASPSGFAVVIGSANLSARSSTPTTVGTSTSAVAVSSAVAGTGSTNVGGAIFPVAGAETASSQAVLAFTVVSLSSALPSNTSPGFAALGGEIAQIAHQIAVSNSILAAGVASASAVSLSAAHVKLPSPVTSPSLAPSTPSSPPPTGPKWGIYLAYQVYTWGGANAMTDFYYKIWITDLTTNPGGPDFCASNSWIANVQINDNVENVPPYPTEDLKFTIPAKTVETVAIDCLWQPSVGNSQPGSMTCDPGETVLCTIPTMSYLTCNGDNPDRILPLSQCVWQ